MKILFTIICSLLVLFPSSGYGNESEIIDLKIITIYSKTQPGNNEFRKYFSLDNNYEWIKINEFKDQNQSTHTRWQQYYKQTKVQSSQLIVSFNKNGKYAVSGKIEKINDAIQAPLTDPCIIFMSQSVLKGKNDIPFNNSEKHFRKLWVWNPVQKTHHVAYEFITHPDDNMEALITTVNASTGNIISAHKSICSINTPGIAETAYHGTQTITTFNNQQQYILKSTNRGQGIETYNLNHQLNYTSVSNYTDMDNHWQQSVHPNQNHATDAHFCAEKYYDMLADKFNLNSINNNGYKLISYMNYGTNLNNAFWNGSAVVYGSGNGIIGPLTTLDITGHEFTHGLIQHTANLNYSNEPGTLNESISDIFGIYLEYYADPLNFNWLVAERSGAAIRSFEEPGLFNQPESYHGNNWYYGTGDNGGVHINSGFINKWFYLIANGGQGIAENGFNYNIPGLGMDNAVAIVYQTLNAYLTPNSGFEDFFFYSLQSTIDNHGICSPEYNQVLEAWQAVNFKNGILTPLEINHQSPVSICDGDSVLLISTGLPGSSFSWFKDGVIINSGNQNYIYASDEGNYKVVEMRCNNTPMENNVFVKLLSLPVVSTVNYEICEGESVLLQSMPSGGVYNIQNPYTGPTTAYSYSIIGNNGCFNSATGTINVSVNPVISITNQITSFPSNADPITLYSSQIGNFYGQGVQGTNFHPSQFSPGDSIIIYCSAVNASGCSTTDSILFNITEPCITELSDVNINSKIISSGDGKHLVEIEVNVSESAFSCNWILSGNTTVLGNNNKAKITVLTTDSELLARVTLTNTCNLNYQLAKNIKLESSSDMMSFNVFPNPSTGEFSIEFHNLKYNELSTLYIYSSEGKLIESINPNENSTKNKLNYSSGNYILKLVTPEGLEIKKLIIN